MEPNGNADPEAELAALAAKDTGKAWEELPPKEYVGVDAGD